jgi:hypothetical protein
MNRSVLLGLAFIVSIVTSSVTLRAQEREKQACVDAFERAQVHRARGRLVAAREQLTTCSRAVCPVLVQQECATLSGEVARAMPSLVVAVRDATGRDVLNARVFVDGSQRRDALAGKPLHLDPGVHTVRAEADGMTPSEERLVIREGDRNRPYTVMLQSPSPLATVTEARKPQPLSSEPSAPQRVVSPVVSYALIGVGAAMVGAGLALDLSSAADVRRMREQCAPDCRDHEINAAKQKYVAALALGGIGLTTAALGTVLLFTKTKPTLAQETGFQVAPTVGGAAAFWRGRF